MHSIAALLAIGATLSVSDARAAVPTVDGPSVGRMHRVIIVDAATPAALKANNPAKQPANAQAQAPARSNARTSQPSVQSETDGADQQRVRAASALPAR
ncbi:MAG TPA: hypothetical protein VEU06_03870 [Micropepsaceae bacterium]|nr:hypothetical protein [Micropepsaceae bacterium]